MIESKERVQRVVNTKPLQAISYASKNTEWRESNVEYFIKQANFRMSGGTYPAKATDATNLDNMKLWYNVYNNRIDESMFSYVTNPLGSKKAMYQQFPAKLRSYNIIRPTIDLLIGEWSKRPFRFDVVNVDGEGVMNSYLDAKYETFKGNVTNRIVKAIEEATGQPVDQKDLPNPATVVDDLNTNYKDLVAIKGYKALKQIEAEHKLKETYKDAFKDWCIAGKVGTLKNVRNSDIEYSKLSPLWIDVDKSVHFKNFEDGSSAVVKFRVTVADLVDMFYEDLKAADLKELEGDEDAHRKSFYGLFTTPGTTTTQEDINKVDLFYTTWKSRKKIGFLSYTDPITGEPLTAEVDENYPVDKEAGEIVEWMWVNEAWGGWRVNDNIYLRIDPLDVQRNEMNNFSACKINVNGRNFSDTESENVSIVSLGLPYQWMYNILNYRIELTIAKSKGKIAVLDKNTISDGSEGGDEKTFYYAEALGYLLLDRNADGVDRSWNQYSTIDLSLFDSIGQLIKLAQYYKDSWDELLGITRQRKGDINSSDGLGTAQESVFRSSVISDIIFSGFDEWVESELQGLLDLSTFAWIDGKKGYYRNDDGRMELFSLEPEDFAKAEMGVFVDVMSRTTAKIELMKQQVNAAAQRKEVKLSTIADMVWTDSYAELKAKLVKAETIEQEIAKQTAENEQEYKKELEAIKKDYLAYNNELEIEKQERDWDRKDNNEYIKGEIAGRVAKDPSGMDIDMTAIEAESEKRLARLADNSLKYMKLKQDDAHAKMKDATEQKKIAASLKNPVVGEK